MPVFENVTFSGGFRFSVPILTYVMQNDWGDFSRAIRGLGEEYAIMYDSITTRHFVPSISSAMYTSADNASTWNRESKGVLTSSSRQGLISFAFNGSNRFVALTNVLQGTSTPKILYSDNATDWTVSSNSTANTANNKVIWSGSNFVTKSSANTMIYSTDGVNWLTASGTTANGTSYFVATDSSNTVVVAQSAGANFLRSTDGGSSFSSVTNIFGNTTYFNGMGYAANTFIVSATQSGGFPVLLYSANGSSWQNAGNIFPTSTSRIYGAASNGDIVVAVQENGIIITSPTSVFPNIPSTKWTSRTSGTTNNLYGVIWNGSKFVVNGQSGIILTSTNGIDWSIAKQSEVVANARMFNSPDYCYAMTGQGNVIVISGLTMETNQGGPNQIWSSTDRGTNWSAYAVAGNLRVADFTYDGSNYLGVGWSDKIYKSTNATTWTVSSMTGNTSLNFDYIAYGPASTNKYMALTSEPRANIFTSTDSSIWTNRGLIQYWPRKLIYANDKYVLLANPHLGFTTLVVVSSTEGTSWSSPSTITSSLTGATETADIAFDGSSTYVVVGGEANTTTGNARVFTSTNLTSWTERNSGIPGRLNTVTFNTALSQFVAAGDQGRIAISTDGITWENISSNITTSRFLFSSGNYLVSDTSLLRLIYQ